MDVLDLLIDGPSFEDLKRESVRDLLRTRANRAATPAFNPQPMAPAPAPMAPPQPQMAPGARALPRAMGGPAPVPSAPGPAAGPDPLMAQFADLQRRQGEALAGVEQAYQPVNRSGAEEMYRKQSQQGGQGLLMALAAQEAGKEFAPVQAHFLKQASEAQAPMKMAGGTMTQSGFIEDPGYGQNLAVQRADAKLRQIDQALQQNLTSQERRRLQAEQERAADERQQAELGMRQSVAQIAAATKSGGQSGVDQDRRFRGEDRMKNDFEQVTKSAREGYDASRQAQVVLNGASGRKLSNIEQQSLITLFNKFLDPSSVVREGEYNRMAQGMGLAQRVQNWQDKIMSGSVITPQMAQEIGRVAGVYQKDAEARVRQQAAEYEAIASTRQYDPNAVIANPAWRGAGGAAMPAGAVRERGAVAPMAPSGGPPPGAVRERRP